ncbi:MAG: alanine/glycine:cation symporter family protein [Lachnospiraceae bacterium]
MEEFLTKVEAINNLIGDIVWVKIGLFLLIGTGILMTVLSKCFQITHLGHWWKKTIGGVFHKSTHNKKDKGGVSQFQALCTALAATIGTGNIAGVSSAIVFGGPGAVFWMWVAAFFGMMTNFAENVLGIYYRRKNANGEWSGGAMYYLQDGLGKYKGCKKLGKVLAICFAVFAILASFGIGNLGQINKIAINLDAAFFSNMEPIVIGGYTLNYRLLIGLVLMIIAGLIIIGGIQRIAAVAERIVPFMACAYVIGTLVVFCMHISSLGAIFASIFRFAFGVKAIGGGIVGISVKTVITLGCKRGVFSNEAGLGSSVMVHSNSNVIEPVKQGMWGIFEVFADTFVVCTMTAVVVLSSGAIDLTTGLAVPGTDDATLVAQAFGNVFGPFGQIFIALAILLFAFTTVLGWSHYGSKSVEYLFGIRAVKAYRIIFTLVIVLGAVLKSSLAWDISDTFNGLMMIPNLIGVISLSPLVVKIINNYVARKLKKENVEPLLSYDETIQNDFAKLVKQGQE